MNCLQKKLKSENGASILLALLFLLVCMMVGASVLMAGASNAGKLRSNQEEHQKYLTVSSALRLICGELEASEYRGHYSYARKDKEKEIEVEEIDENGKLVVKTDTVHDYFVHTYAQMEGEFECGLNATGQVLPLADNLDRLFAQRVQAGAGVEENPDDMYEYKPKNTVFPTTRYTLTVSAEGFEPVTVLFEMRKDGVVHLTASLAGKYAMEAELTPKEHLDKVLILKSAAEFDDSEQGDFPETEEKMEAKTEAVTWKLEWIDKKEEVPGP